MKKKWLWTLLVVLGIGFLIWTSGNIPWVTFATWVPDGISRDVVDSLLFLAGSVVAVLFFVLILITIVALYKKRKSRAKEVKSVKTEDATPKKGGFWKNAQNNISTFTSFVFIFGGWLIFVATIYYLHPKLWEAWYGNQPLFWISQASFVLVFAVFNKAKSLFYLLLVIAISASLWIGFKDELTKKGLIDKPTTKAAILHPTRKKYMLCRDNRNGVKTCKPDGVVIVVKMQEYHDGIFTFTASWKEKGGVKQRALFRWDRIANPNYGTWHQLGSKRKDGGTWRLEAPGKDGIFHGWHTAKNGKKYSMSLELN